MRGGDNINEAYNMDCLDAMRQMPDKAFDLAIVDPPYGGGAGSQFVQVERERAGPTGLVGGHADYEHRKRSRFGGWFDKYHIDNADGRGLVGQVSDAHRGYL
jgi:DNA modification methylase